MAVCEILLKGLGSLINYNYFLFAFFNIISMEKLKPKHFKDFNTTLTNKNIFE